ncbi:unnamed protein product [Microthlaspi erraticum]|uniref:F-box domain-containing protein n=1 Tax=Microthlaspi erraticum TaxID=1685480 RepID=A0A6D2JB67_9BRAS|nr:unnamed protein product [Microthlaspi erraticum]
MERPPSSSDARGETIPDHEFNTDDQISELSTDLLLKISSTLSTEEIVRTSVMSKRWMDVWKETSCLLLDLRKIPKASTVDIAKSVTKVIKDHLGPLERCTISHYSRQCEGKGVESWIQSLTHQKHTKDLTLENHFEGKSESRITLNLPPGTLSHPDLESLSLSCYTLEAPHAFNNCWNLKRLNLDGILAEIGVMNEVLVSCSSLEALTLRIIFYTSRGVLKIGNPKLKFLYLSCSMIDGVEVSTHSLDILSIGSLVCVFKNFIIANPRLQQFRRSFWRRGAYFAHTTYDITCSNQEKKSIGHELMTSGSGDFVKTFSGISLGVDMTNTKEVEMLKEVLFAWPEELGEIEIFFKDDNSPMQKGESSTGGTHKKFCEDTKQLANTGFHASTVWLMNFSGSQEEFELASYFITQGIVVWCMEIVLPSSVSPSKKLELEAVVAKLKKLPKRHKGLGIQIWY